MNFETVKLGLVASFLILVAGCAATPTTSRQQAENVNLASFNNAYIVINAKEDIKNKDGYAKTADLLRNALQTNLKKMNVFKGVMLEEIKDNSVEINVEISEFNYVSGASRGILGVVAGRAVLQVTMRVIDSKTRKTLITVNSGHRSHQGQGVFSPVTSAQIKSIASELANNIR